MKSFQPRVFITFFPSKSWVKIGPRFKELFIVQSVIGIVATYLLHQLQSIGADKQLRVELY
jgi:hypothetical protein